MNPHLQTLQAVRAIAEAAVKDVSTDFSVAAVLPSEAHGAYAEVLVVRTQTADEPKSLLIGVDRESSDVAIRAAVAASLPQ